jgi:hypothetical protein
LYPTVKGNVWIHKHTHTHTKEKRKNLNCRKSDNSVASAREESPHWWSRAATTERRD